MPVRRCLPVAATFCGILACSSRPSVIAATFPRRRENLILWHRKRSDEPLSMVVEDSYGIVPDEVPSAVCRLFGFAVSTDELTAGIVPHRDAMLREGILAVRGVSLVLVGNSKSEASGRRAYCPTSKAKSAI